MNFEIPDDGVLLIKDEPPKVIKRGVCYDKDGQKLKILNWGYPGVCGFCPNDLGEYNVQFIYLQLESTVEMDDDDLTDRIRNITCGNISQLPNKAQKKTL